MRICTKCIQPDTRPGVFFNEESVCGACLWEDEKKKIDWAERKKELEIVVKKKKFLKMETIIKVILELGVCEIIYFKNLSHKISIAEYNKVSSSFLNKNEVGLINGILDKIANNITDE